jgi:hypothetical protein
VGTPLLITEYYPRIPEHDVAEPMTRLTPNFHDIRITNLTATRAKNAGVIAGLPERPINSLVLDNVHLEGQKGLRISNAVVTAHRLSVQAASGPPIVLLDNAKLIRR